jgi:enterochelin esterase family protein
VAAFWQEIGPRGSPLIERVQDPASRLVTFLWRGGDGTKSVLLRFGPCMADDPVKCLMIHLAGTDLWYKPLLLC